MNKGLCSIIDEAIRTKKFVGGLGRLKKDGSIKKINGQIFERKITADGNVVILIDNFFGNARPHSQKRWQMVLLENIIALNFERWNYTRKAE